MFAKKERVKFRKFRNLILKNLLVVFHGCSPMLLLLWKLVLSWAFGLDSWEISFVWLFWWAGWFKQWWWLRSMKGGWKRQYPHSGFLSQWWTHQGGCFQISFRVERGGGGRIQKVGIFQYHNVYDFNIDEEINQQWILQAHCFRISSAVKRGWVGAKNLEELWIFEERRTEGERFQ